MNTDFSRFRIVGVLALEAEAVRATQALATAGVQTAVFKGAWLAELWRRDGQFREYSDIDLLVSVSQRQDALDALTDSPTRWSLPSGERTPGDVTLIQTSAGAIIDLQTHVLHESELKQTFVLDIPAMLSRRRFVEVGGWACPVLDAEDNLIVTCLHALRSDPLAERAAVDVHMCLTHDDIRWEVLLDRAAKARAGLVVGMMLDRARHICGTYVPGPASRQLAPVIGWRGLLRVSRAWRPNAKSVGRRMSAGSLFSATRRSSFSSARSFVCQRLRAEKA